MLRKLEFGASHVYSPRGQTPLSLRSRELVGRLKRGDPQILPRFAERVFSLAQQGRIPHFFGPQVTLVPVPGSSPLVHNGLWVPLLLARALRELALARDVVPILARVSAVRKSALAAPGERPTVQQHYDSFAAQIVAPAPIQIVLIDDVVTAGSTLLAAAGRIAEAYPAASVRAFALIRTMSGVEIDQVVAPATGTIVSPCVGWIKPRGDRALRQP